jgi:putative SbcD/Mre11-related phosphoesterase
MSPIIEPLVDEPALIVENTIRVLVVADIHLGMEWDLQNSGIVIPSQSAKGLKRMMNYVGSSNPDRIVLLGDLKHNIPHISWQERQEVPRFIEHIAQKIPIDISPGNHDGDMEFLLRFIPEGLEVILQPAKGFILDGVGYFHGHTWPAAELLSCDHIIMAHNHPTIRFTDTLGSSSTEPAWIRTSMIRQPLEEHYCSDNEKLAWADPQVIIMPAFCELCGGVAFNESLHDDLLGPVFSSMAVDIDSAEAYLLDGTRLGTLSDLKKLNITKKRPPRKRTAKTRGKVSQSP